MTPIQASLKKNERFVYNNFLDKRKKVNPKIQINDLVGTADLRKKVSKSDTTNWSLILNQISEKNNVTIPSYKIDKLKESYNNSLLKQTDLTVKKN